MNQQIRPVTTSDRLARLPAALRAYARCADEDRIPDSGLGDAMRFAGECIETFLSVLQGVRAVDIERYTSGGRLLPRDLRKRIADLLGDTDPGDEP